MSEAQPPPDPEFCPKSEHENTHCECWWDGHDPCCYCGDNTAPCDCEQPNNCAGQKP